MSGFVVREEVVQRVRYIPLTDYAIRCHKYETLDSPGIYRGRPADGGPAYAADADGFAQDAYMMNNMLGWVEERIEYVIVNPPQPTPWEPVPEWPSLAERSAS